MGLTNSQLADRSSPIAAKFGLFSKLQALLAKEAAAKLKIVSAAYSFAIDGGAVGTIPLRTAVVPIGGIILGGLVDVTTLLTGGALAAAALTAQSANDLVAAAVVTGAPWSTTGLKAIVPAYTAATAIKATAERTISLVVSATALTAGIFTVHVAYIDTLNATAVPTIDG